MVLPAVSICAERKNKAVAAAIDTKAATDAAADLDEADPLFRLQLSALKHDSTDTSGLNVERVESRSGVGLVCVGFHAIEVNLLAGKD